MYPTLSLDTARASWIDKTVTTLRAFGEQHRAELEAANRAGRLPRDLYVEMGRLGFLGPLVPTDYGGMGGDVGEYVVIAEEVGRHGLVSGQIAAQGQRWLLDWGTPEQKERWLEGIATGRIIFSESISEPGAGSSFKGMRATARRDGGDWLLDGVKTHVNLGADCDVTLVYAIAVDGEQDLGLTSFLVDTSLPGISTRLTDPVGLRLIPTADVAFQQVRLPDAALLGAPGEGLQTFLSTFNVSRLGNAAELIGLGRRALALAVDYGSQREVGNNVVTDFQGIQWQLADRHAALYAASLARDHAALAAERGEDIAMTTSLAKKLAIDAAQDAARDALSLVGGHGLYFDQPYSDILGDIRVLRVAGGSLEVLRNYIARRVLADPAGEGLA